MLYAICICVLLDAFAFASVSMNLYIMCVFVRLFHTQDNDASHIICRINAANHRNQILTKIVS